MRVKVKEGGSGRFEWRVTGWRGEKEEREGEREIESGGKGVR